MLKHAIDTYNYLLDIADKLKLRVTTMVGLLAVLIAGASLLTAQALDGYSGDKVSSSSEMTEEVAGQASGLSEQGSTEAVTDKKDTAQPGAKPAEPAKQPAVAESRQPASSDTAAKSSFSTKIERNSQIAAGTLIAYNASKDLKTYYGGDLSFSDTTLTISKSGPAAATAGLTVTAPGEAIVNVPAVSKDDPSAYLAIAATGNEAPQSGRSFAMTVEALANTPVGSYQLHISTSKVGQSDEVWVYHGFVTVNVVE